MLRWLHRLFFHKRDCQRCLAAWRTAQRTGWGGYWATADRVPESGVRMAIYGGSDPT